MYRIIFDILLLLLVVLCTSFRLTFVLSALILFCLASYKLTKQIHKEQYVKGCKNVTANKTENKTENKMKKICTPTLFTRHLAS